MSSPRIPIRRVRRVSWVQAVPHLLQGAVQARQLIPSRNLVLRVRPPTQLETAPRSLLQGESQTLLVPCQNTLEPVVETTAPEQGRRPIRTPTPNTTSLAYSKCRKRHRRDLEKPNLTELIRSGRGKIPVGQRGARLSERQPAVRIPVRCFISRSRLPTRAILNTRHCRHFGYCRLP
jgi:hypothetical protein